MRRTSLPRIFETQPVSGPEVDSANQLDDCDIPFGNFIAYLPSPENTNLTGSINVLQPTSWWFCVDSAALLVCWMNNSFTCLDKSKPVKQEVNHTVITPPYGEYSLPSQALKKRNDCYKTVLGQTNFTFKITFRWPTSIVRNSSFSKTFETLHNLDAASSWN